MGNPIGFVTDALGITGSGPKNEFTATAPVNTFQAQAANLDQSNFGGSIDQAQQQALGVNPQWQQLSQQLQAQAAGQGPSLAQLQLQQATQQQQAQAAGAIASQRGINPAMAARLISQNQAQLGQQAAGQSAQLRMAEQMGARQQLAGVLGAQQSGALGMLGTAGQLQQGQNAARIQNSLGTQALNQQTAAQNAQMNLGAQQINAGVQGQNAQTNAGIVGGLMQGGGAALAFLNRGGAVPQRMADGGGVSGLESVPWYGIPDFGGAGGKALQQGFGDLGAGISKAMGKKKDAGGNANAFPNSPMMDAQPMGSPYASPWPGADALLTPAMARGGEVGPTERPGPSSHLGRFLAGHQASASTKPHVEAMAKLEKGGVLDYRSGGELPGRAQVHGDSPKNDTVPIMGSPGEIMLPRSVTEAPDAPDRAAEFVRRLQRRSGKSKGYERVAKARKGAA